MKDARPDAASYEGICVQVCAVHWRGHRPEEYVYGATILQVDDEVLLMRSSDGQTYYLLERMVELP